MIEYIPAIIGLIMFVSGTVIEFSDNIRQKLDMGGIGIFISILGFFIFFLSGFMMQ